ncbi:MAG: 2-oxoglutarate dehydrogenase E2 component (dihydrolipoamide succinyltransferase) [Bacteroidia bacterium]|jgi:2-oxoglutarate dehydrogenase E2 component (dihydrolipoamide succinyltransferase)
MPIVEITVPSPGESITEVEIASFLKQDGDYVFLDEEMCEVDSDKATLTIPAEKAGTITWKVEEGDAVQVGGVICTIDTDAKPPKEAPAKKAEVVAAPVAEVVKESPKAVASAPLAASGPITPVAKKMMSENGISPSQVTGSGTGGRVTKKDVLEAMSSGFAIGDAGQSWAGGREQRREKMSMLRRKVAERLVAVKSETAMLTTFNEVNMKPIMDLRNKYKKTFGETHGVNLGFMSFFTKAVTEALYHYPAVNAMIDGKEMIFHDYCDIGIAVSSPKGLMVPVLRNAEQLSLAEIEAGIKGLAVKARDGKISIDEMTGGTFTITNGGVFGSMMSTPILNPPQSAILGMHNIVERAIVENGEIVARPMMYLALSYDHRVIDGKESVSFLVKVKNMLENPSTMLFGGKNNEEVLLGL